MDILDELLDPPDTPLETGLFNIQWVAYAGEGWESQAPISQTKCA